MAAVGKLRVGVFADAALQPRWVVEAFERIARSDFAEIVRVRIEDRPAPSAPLLWRLYARADRWAFGDDGCEPVALPQWAPPSSTEETLDVAFALGAVNERSLEGLARFGVWRFCFGAGAAHAESLAGLREVAAAEPVIRSGVLVHLGHSAPPRLAYESWSRTDALSVARHRAHLVRKTSEFAWRALRELERGGRAWLERCRVVREPGAGEREEGDERLGAVRGVAGRLLRRAAEKAFGVEQWFLAWRFGEPCVPPGDLRGFMRARPPKDRTWADPFVLAKNGRYFVFFEELPFAAGKAHISMIEVKRGGGVSSAERVLERDYHLSYPFLVEDGGELYMVPESAQSGAVELYRCVDFPRRWKREQVLIDGRRLVDATLYRGADRWWMFANAAAEGSRVFDDELHVFYAGQLRGPWRPHARNPVKSDVRAARPAGALFMRAGALYRPAQVCAPRYGAGLCIHRVLQLTPEDYEEREVDRVLPAGGLLGLHTLNRAGDLTVVDAFARHARFSRRPWTPLHAS